MLILFLSEFRAYVSVNTHEHMVVDSSLNEKLQINLDISFLAISCRGAFVHTLSLSTSHGSHSRTCLSSYC